MLRALYTGASGMSAAGNEPRQCGQQSGQLQHRGISQAAAAIRRPALSKRDHAGRSFDPANYRGRGSADWSGIALGGVIVQSQGDFSQTGNSLDLAIQGQGFFQVTMPSGETAYTRSGAFHLDAQGNVVTASGNAMDPAITIPPNATSVTIGSDGTVSVTTPGQAAAQQVGTVQLAIFQNPGGLNSVGNNLF